MKITQDDYNKLEQAIIDIGIDNVHHVLLAAKHNDWSPMAYRWELFHCANKPPEFKFGYLYDYLNDSHLDTALRKITTELGITGTAILKNLKISSVF